MKHTQLRRFVKVHRTRAWGIALSALAATGATWACSGVGPPGQPVVFGDQTNIVIWDEAHHVEHFIRNASFKSGATDFGFIAPTPDKPTLEQASSKAFYTLASLAPSQGFRGFGGGDRMSGGAMAKRSEVQVIQEADVAGYHATTVWSRDAHAINDWMNAHGYVSTPEVEKWAERYCGRGWYLTAFKVTDRAKLLASTGTIRMTFKTYHPYNPFYVPKTNIPINGGGTLRVYLVSVGSYDAHIGPRGDTWQVPQWTVPVPEAQQALLAKQVKLPFDAVPDNCQVETFVDNNFPRPAKDDIYFTKRDSPISSLTLPPVPTQSRSFPSGVLLSSVAGFGLLALAGLRRGR